MIMKGIKVKNPIIGLKLKKIDTQYARTGTAYDYDQKQLPSNTPGLKHIDKVKGIASYTLTTNLFTEALSQSFATPWTSGTLNGTYTISIQGTGGSIELSGGATGTITAGNSLTVTVSSATVTFTPTGTPTFCQLEKLAYPTPFTLGGTTRPYSLISIPHQVMNVSAFTIKFEFYVDNYFYNKGVLRLFEMIGNQKNRVVIQVGGSGAFSCGMSNNDGTATTITGTTDHLSVGWHEIELKADSTSAKAYIDKAQIGTTQNSPNLPTKTNLTLLGCGHYNKAAESWSNVPIRNLHISKIKRSDIESTGAYNVDKNTTYFASFEDNTNTYQYKNTTHRIPGQTTRNISTNQSKYEAWPSIAKLADGTLLISYRTSDTNVHGYEATGKKVLRRSNDNGLTWGEEITITKIGDGLDNRNGGMLVFMDDTTETILHTFNTYAADGTQNTYSTKSVDGGLTWSEPVLVANNRQTNCNPLKLSNGDLIFSAFEISSGAVGSHLYLERSTDNGATWAESTITTDATNKLNETTLIETKTDGEYTGGVVIYSRSSVYSTNFQKKTSTDYGANWGSGSVDSYLTDQGMSRMMLERVSTSKIIALYPVTTGFVIVESSDETATWGNPIFVPSSTGPYPDAVYLNGNYLVVWCSNYFTPESSDILLTTIDGVV